MNQKNAQRVADTEPPSEPLPSPGQLRARVLEEWSRLFPSGAGYPSIGLEGQPHGKQILRQRHAEATKAILVRNQEWIQRKAPGLLPYFASGADLDISRIQPQLVEVASGKERDLFRFANYTWSIPINKGYGRRLRFLIMDAYHHKLMGILGLQSPPLDFSPRDKLVSYPPGRKIELVNQTMDIHVLGAVPPYSWLLGGKLIVQAAASNEVWEAYRRRYDGRITQLQKDFIPPELVALTTTSAFGRSSLYNRVFFEQQGQRYRLTESLGLLKGYGVYHFSDELYQQLKAFVADQIPGRKVVGFGSGPKIKWQVITLALKRLKLSVRLMRHEVAREAYIIRLVDNFEAYMSGEDTKPHYYHLPFEELAAFWREYYLLSARRNRPPIWQQWHREELLKGLILPDSYSPREANKDVCPLALCSCPSPPD